MKHLKLNREIEKNPVTSKEILFTDERIDRSYANQITNLTVNRATLKYSRFG